MSVRLSRLSTAARVWGFVLLALALLSITNWLPAQNVDEATRQADIALSDKPVESKSDPNAGANQNPAAPELDLLDMANPNGKNGGGIFMWPIYAFSFIVVLFIIERALALRRRRVIPPELVEAFGNLAGAQTGFDPRKAYRLCQQHPSTASNVIRSMLLKIGRPHSEVEHAVTQANEREADKLYRNVRPLNLAASAAPLLGLIGTVQGMIIAFFVTAHMAEGANKAQKLAEGVYVALITTFAGLCVAIPAVMAAHFFEGKIQRLFGEIDDLVYNLLPQLERYEGKMRVSRQQLAGSSEPGERTEKGQPATSAAE